MSKETFRLQAFPCGGAQTPCADARVSAYEELYASGAYAPLGERRRLAALVRREETVTWPSRFGVFDPLPGPEPAAAALDDQTTLF